MTLIVQDTYFIPGPRETGISKQPPPPLLTLITTNPQQ